MINEFRPYEAGNPTICCQWGWLRSNFVALCLNKTKHGVQ
jgi:hypothetical protein